MAVAKEKRFTIADPDAVATSGQTYALYRICGVDVREINLTKGQASDLIDTAQTKAYHVRAALTKLGGSVKTRDVHKSHRGDPAANGKKPPKVTPDTELNDAAVYAMLKKRFGKDVADAMLNSEIPKAKAKPKAKPKAKAKAAPKAKAQTPTKESDLSDDDMLDSLVDSIMGQTT